MLPLLDGWFNKMRLLAGETLISQVNHNRAKTITAMMNELAAGTVNGTTVLRGADLVSFTKEIDLLKRTREFRNKESR
jgi:hypothetical protein